jgi:hypothetical protein
LLASKFVFFYVGQTISRFFVKRLCAHTTCENICVNFSFDFFFFWHFKICQILHSNNGNICHESQNSTPLLLWHILYIIHILNRSSNIFPTSTSHCGSRGIKNSILNLSRHLPRPKFQPSSKLICLSRLLISKIFLWWINMWEILDLTHSDKHEETKCWINIEQNFFAQIAAVTFLSISCGTSLIHQYVT